MKYICISLAAAGLFAGCCTDCAPCNAKTGSCCAGGACEAPVPVAPNTLTAAEKAAGWQLLWDGKSFDGWVGERNGCKAPPEKGWTSRRSRPRSAAAATS